MESLIPRVGLFAKRNINALEEITFDYGANCTDTQESKFPCYCGSSNCRKFLPFNPLT